MQQMSHAQNRTTESQFTNCIDRTSDTVYIIYVRCVDPRERLCRLRRHQVVPEPHDLLSTVVTWKRQATQDH